MGADPVEADLKRRPKADSSYLIQVPLGDQQAVGKDPADVNPLVCQQGDNLQNILSQEWLAAGQ